MVFRFWRPYARSPANWAAESIWKLPRVDWESSRGYGKAPEGRRDKKTFRRPSDDLVPTGSGLLLFLKMFKNSSRSLFRYPTLVGLRRSRQTFPRPFQVIAPDCPQVPDCFPRYAADQPYIEIGYYRNQNNPWWNGGIRQVYAQYR